MDVKTGKSQLIVVVYALNTIEHRKPLWEFIDRCLQNQSRPVLLGGDFNAILNLEDRFQGNPVQNIEVVDFQACLERNILQEVRAIGPTFTWTNNQEGQQRIYTNIDRSFANISWFSEYSNVVVERLDKNVSDHNPQLLRFEQEEMRGGLFRFYNVIADHDNFLQIVRDNWRGASSLNLLRNVWLKCQRLKAPLKAINTQCFKNTTEKVNRIRAHL